jgi:NifU-like protein involved in Fe-S cluster formation
MLSLPPIKIHCSVLAEEAIERAILDWEKKVKHRQHNQLGGDNGS